MTLELHHLTTDFPEHATAINRLKLSDPHFSRLFKEYDALSHMIYRIEAEAEAASDERLEALKKERLKLKDALFAMLVTDAA